MIQVLPGLRLNSSTKRWYSLGSSKVRGKKSHFAASKRPDSRSRNFRYLFRFFTMRFFLVSWNKTREEAKERPSRSIATYCAHRECIVLSCGCHANKKQMSSLMMTEMLNSKRHDFLLHSGCESGIFAHVPPCRNDHSSLVAIQHHTSWSPIQHHWK